MKTSITPQDVVDLMNEVLELDRDAGRWLFNGLYAPCNEALANHPTIQCRDGGGPDPYLVRTLGFLNGLFGIDQETGFGPITAIYKTNKLTGEDILVHFELTDFEQIKLQIKTAAEAVATISEIAEQHR